MKAITASILLSKGVLAVFFIFLERRGKMMRNLNQICIEDDVERLIILRKRLKLNQFQFAKEIGISSSYLRKVESRTIPFPFKFRKKIDEYLKQEHLIYEKGSNLYK